VKSRKLKSQHLFAKCVNPNFLNDISFVIDGRFVVMIEHQSSMNPNMPLRMLLYIARVYEKIVSNDNLYGSKKIAIPNPEFIVLYNGDDECPDRQVLRLSDMFSEPLAGSLAKLELEVNVYNINKGRNEEFAIRSEKLKGYETFIYLVKEYVKSMDRGSAIKRAIGDCIRQDVLRDFLKEHGSEVHNMLLSGWNWDDAKRVWQREAREDGIEIGIEKGKAESREEILSLIKQGYSLADIENMLKAQPRG